MQSVEPRSVDMTRYLERDALRDLLAKSKDPCALKLFKALELRDSMELIDVTPVNGAELLPTYEVRLEAAETGAGPRTCGLADFVSALREQVVVEAFSVREGDITGIGLFGTSGQIVAVTLVLRGRPNPPSPKEDWGRREL